MVAVMWAGASAWAVSVREQLRGDPPDPFFGVVTVGIGVMDCLGDAPCVVALVRPQTLHRVRPSLRRRRQRTRHSLAGSPA